MILELQMPYFREIASFLPVSACLIFNREFRQVIESRLVHFELGLRDTLKYRLFSVVDLVPVIFAGTLCAALAMVLLACCSEAGFACLYTLSPNIAVGTDFGILYINVLVLLLLVAGGYGCVIYYRWRLACEIRRIAPTGEIFSGVIALQDDGAFSISPKFGSSRSKELNGILSRKNFKEAVRKAAANGGNVCESGEIGNVCYNASFYADEAVTGSRPVFYFVYRSERSRQVIKRRDRFTFVQNEMLNFANISGRLFKHIVDLSHLKVCFLDADDGFKIFYAAPDFEKEFRVFNWRGKTAADFFDEKSASYVQRVSESVLKDGKSRFCWFTVSSSGQKSFIHSEFSLLINRVDGRRLVSFKILPYVSERSDSELWDELMRMFGSVFETAAPYSLSLYRYDTAAHGFKEINSFSNRRMLDFIEEEKNKHGGVLPSELVENFDMDSFQLHSGIIENLDSDDRSGWNSPAAFGNDIPGRLVYASSSAFSSAYFGRELSVERRVLLIGGGNLCSVFSVSARVGMKRKSSDIIYSMFDIVRNHSASGGFSSADIDDCVCDFSVHVRDSYASWAENTESGFRLRSNIYRNGSPVTADIREISARMHVCLDEAVKRLVQQEGNDSAVSGFVKLSFCREDSGNFRAEEDGPENDGAEFRCLAASIAAPNGGIDGLMIIETDFSTWASVDSRLCINTFCRNVSLACKAEYMADKLAFRESGKLIDGFDFPIWCWNDADGGSVDANAAASAGGWEEKVCKVCEYDLQSEAVEDYLPVSKQIEELKELVLRSGASEKSLISIDDDKYILTAVPVKIEQPDFISLMHSSIVFMMFYCGAERGEDEIEASSELFSKVLDSSPYVIQAELYKNTGLANCLFRSGNFQLSAAENSGNFCDSASGRFIFPYDVKSDSIKYIHGEKLQIDIGRKAEYDKVVRERSVFLSECLATVLKSEDGFADTMLNYCRRTFGAEFCTLMAVERLDDGTVCCELKYLDSSINWLRNCREITDCTADDFAKLAQIEKEEYFFDSGFSLTGFVGRKLNASLRYRYAGVVIDGSLAYLFCVGIAGSQQDNESDRQFFLALRRIFEFFFESVRFGRTTENNVKSMEKSIYSQMMFLSSMSHEIRHPLNAILGYSDVFADEDGTDAPALTTEEEIEYCRNIWQAANSLMQLFADVKNISMLEAGDSSCITYESRDMRSVFEEIYNICAFSCKKKGLELKYKVEDDVPESVRTCWQFVRQAMLNLVGNAIKFTSEGSITITGRFEASGSEGGTAVISVCDTGCGISEEDQKGLFAPFAQFYLSDIIGSKSRGTGLGLSISNTVISKIGGKITCSSKIDRGSTFTITLPGLTYK